MTSIPLGKIPVPTPGTPVAITLTNAQKAQLPPSGLCRVEVWADPADANNVYVKQGGVVLKTLQKPQTGFTDGWVSPDEYQVNPTAYQVDAVTATNGPFVTLWVE